MNVCRSCGNELSASGRCTPCLLQTGLVADGQSLAERLFQAALAMDESERAAFIKDGAAGNETLLEEVEMLLEGYAEAGGDAALPTLGSGTARSQWAAAKREEPGTVIDHFRLVKSIGQGGMGTVWEADQLAPIQRKVALKIIKLGMDTEEVVRRFERERSTLALMKHPHIAQVFEAGATSSGRPYFAMELVEGEAITTYSVKNNLSVRERLGLFLQVCDAVEHAHQKGVIHRDLKPSNLLVSDGEAKVIDFGVAKATQPDATALLTQQAQVLGTPAYMSPEQADSEGADVDTRSDVYSLGVVLYELLCGSLPFAPERFASTGMREISRILREEAPPRPSTRAGNSQRSNQAQPIHRADVPRDLDWIVMLALSKERERRYASAAAFSDDVRRFLNGAVVKAVPPTLAYRAGKFMRKHRLAVAALAAVLMALTGGLAVSLLQIQRTNQALAGEAKARAETTFTLTDLYTRSGLTAAENGDPTRAALWFANAAILGEKDPNRAVSNRLRAETWRQSAPVAVAAFQTGYEHLKTLQWHPHGDAMIAEAVNVGEAQVWDLATEQRWEPQRSIVCGAWSSQGNFLAVGLPTRELLVLEYPSGKELARLPEANMGKIAWSQDDRWIAGGNVLWDWQKNELHTLPKPPSNARFSRDGKFLLLQWAEFAGVCSLSEPEKWLFPPVASSVGDGADFLGQGDRFVVCRTDGVVMIHESATGATLAQFPNEGSRAQLGPILDVSVDGRFLTLKRMPLLDLQSGAGSQLGNQVLTEAHRFSPDGTMLALGDYANRLELWSVATGRSLGVIGHHHSGVVNVAWSADGKFIASGEDGLVRVWALERAVPARFIPAGGASMAALSPDGTHIAPSGYTFVASQVDRTRTYDLNDGHPAGPEILPGGKLMDAVFGHDGLWLAVSQTQDRRTEFFETSGGSGNIQLWDSATGKRLGDPIAMPSEPRGLALHPSGKWLAVCCAGGEGLEIDLASHSVRQLYKDRINTHAGSLLNNGRCTYSPDGRVLAVWGTYPFMHLWDREAGRDLVEPFERETNTFDVAFCGNTVVRALFAPKMRFDFLSLRTGAPTAPAIVTSTGPYLTCFSEDGMLLTASAGKSAQIWNWQTGKLLCPALPHDDAIMAGCFVPGTPWVITGGNDGQIKFWDRRSGMMIRPPLQRSGMALQLRLSPDARTLIACGNLAGNIELFRLADLLPSVTADPARLLLQAEVDADATVHPSGGLAPLTANDWLGKWQRLHKEFANPSRN